MQKYAKIEDDKSKICSVGIGTNSSYYESIGYQLMDVEHAYNGQWYLSGYAPEKPDDTKKAEIRHIRDNLLNGMTWRIERYEEQVELGIEPTDTPEVYKMIIRYRQYLRDYPASSADWFEREPLTFEAWSAANG